MTNSDDPLPIHRCVCGETAFAELWSVGVRTLDEAARHGCGVSCGLCRPYLIRMFETGETSFSVD